MKVVKVLICVTNIDCNCETSKTVCLRSKFLENNIKNVGLYLIKVQCRHFEEQMVNALLVWVCVCVGGGKLLLIGSTVIIKIQMRFVLVQFWNFRWQCMHYHHCKQLKV